MTRRDLGWRLFGVALVTTGCAASLTQGAAHPAYAQGAADGGAAAIGLAGFALACFGVALIVQGAVFRDRWKRERHRQSRLRHKRAHRPHRHDDDGMQRNEAFGAGRDAMAALLAERALRRGHSPVVSHRGD